MGDQMESNKNSEQEPLALFHAKWLENSLTIGAGEAGAELKRLYFEVQRLTQALKQANSQAEHFEREWYLRGDQIEALAQQEIQDELQSAANWLLQAIPGCQVSDIQSRLMLGYNRAQRLYDCAVQVSKAQTNEPVAVQQQASAPVCQPMSPSIAQSWELDEEACKFLVDMIAADPDQITRIGFHLGYAKDDDGNLVHSFSVYETEYPEEGVHPLVQTKPNQTVQPVVPGATLFHMFEDGKYSVSFADGKLCAFRNGLMWQDLTGDKLIYSMLAEVDSLKSRLAAVGSSPLQPAPLSSCVLRELVRLLKEYVGADTDPIELNPRKRSAISTLAAAKEHGL